MTPRTKAALALALLVAACASAPQTDWFGEGEHLYLDGKYDDAVASFKHVLMEKPWDAGAHFYLGTCYLYSPNNAWLGIAQGELETALNLFERQGKVNPVPRFDTSEYFELICHINLAKVCLRLITSITDAPGNRLQTTRIGALQAITNQLVHEYDDARRISPQNADVRGLGEQIARVVLLVRGLQQTPEGRPPDRPARPNGGNVLQSSPGFPI